MSLWKNKDREDWAYSFQYKFKRYGGRGFKTKAEARKSQEERRKEIVLNQKTDSGNREPKTMVELKEKYFEMYQNPNIIIADIFDCVMKDLDIPVRFSDIKEVINCKSRKKIPPAIRSEILAAHGFKCKWCGRDSGDVKLEIDHIVPVSKGGLTEKRNLQVLCRECNCGKTDKSPYAMKA